MSIDIIEIEGETDGAGDSIDDSDGIAFGEVVRVEVRGDGLAAGADLNLDIVAQELGGVESVGERLIANLAVGAADGEGGRDLSFLYPRRLEENAAGGTLDLSAEAGAQQNSVPFVVGGHKLRATIANGGDTLPYKVLVYVRN